VIRVLLLGATGQVGSALQPLLAPRFEVLAPGRRDLDLSDGEALRSYLHRARPTVIVNAAAYTAVDRVEDAPEVAWATNAAAPAIMAQCAEALGAALIHYSTDYVFDGAKDSPYTEADAPAPLSEYGRTKLAGDEAIMTTPAPYLIFRTGWVYGASGQNFLLTMQRLLRERSEVRVVDDQVGAPTWSRTIAAVTVQILDQAAESPLEFIRANSGLYNLAARGQTSWYGFASAIREDLVRRQCGVGRLIPITTSEYPTPARRPRFTVLDTSRLRDRFGLALPPWREGLEQALAEVAGAAEGEVQA